MSFSIWYSTDLSADNWIRDFGAIQRPAVSGGVSDIETVLVSISASLLNHARLFVQVRAN